MTDNTEGTGKVVAYGDRSVTIMERDRENMAVEYWRDPRDRMVGFASARIDQIALSMSQAGAKFPVIEKTKTGKVHYKAKDNRPAGSYEYKYADLADIIRVIGPILGENGLWFTQLPIMNNEFLNLRTTIIHKSGQFITADYPVAILQGYLNHQSIGGAMTYARRYALCSMLGIVSDEDRDEQPEDVNQDRPNDDRRRNSDGRERREFREDQKRDAAADRHEERGSQGRERRDISDRPEDRREPGREQAGGREHTGRGSDRDSRHDGEPSTRRERREEPRGERTQERKPSPQDERAIWEEKVITFGLNNPEKYRTQLDAQLAECTTLVGLDKEFDRLLPEKLKTKMHIDDFDKIARLYNQHKSRIEDQGFSGDGDTVDFATGKPLDDRPVDPHEEANGRDPVEEDRAREREQGERQDDARRLEADKEELRNAYERGKQAREQRMSKRAIPTEYRDNEKLTNEWLTGWEDEDKK